MPMKDGQGERHKKHPQSQQRTGLEMAAASCKRLHRSRSARGCSEARDASVASQSFRAGVKIIIVTRTSNCKRRCLGRTASRPSEGMRTLPSSAGQPARFGVWRSTPPARLEQRGDVHSSRCPLLAVKRRPRFVGFQWHTPTMLQSQPTPGRSSSPLKKCFAGENAKKAARTRRQLADISARYVEIWQRSDCRFPPFAAQMTFLNGQLDHAFDFFFDLARNRHLDRLLVIVQRFPGRTMAIGRRTWHRNFASQDRCDVR